MSKHAVIFNLIFVLVWFLTAATAMAVVYVTFESRQTYRELNALVREENGLRVLEGQFQLEKSVWSDFSRIEKTAREELQMKAPEINETTLVYQ